MKTRAYYLAALGWVASLCFAVAKDNPLQSICLQSTKNGLSTSLNAPSITGDDLIAADASTCDKALDAAFAVCKKTTENASSTGENSGGVPGAVGGEPYGCRTKGRCGSYEK